MSEILTFIALIVFFAIIAAVAHSFKDKTPFLIKTLVFVILLSIFIASVVQFLRIIN